MNDALQTDLFPNLNSNVALAPTPTPIAPPPTRKRTPAETVDSGTTAAVDDYIKRVEKMLDATELAIALVQEEDRGTPSVLDCRLSVVMPCFNERETIREIVRRVQAVPLDKEIIIVDDCSTDGTREILKELEAEPNIRVVYHQYNHGKGAALRTGFLHCTGEIVLVQDADLEYDPRDYVRLVQPIIDGETDVVYGSRFLGSEVRDPSLLHRLGNRMLTCASNLLTGQKLTDMETCYKVFRRSAIEDIDIKQDRFGFEPEITAKLSRRKQQIVEVPIAYHGRGYEEGKKIGMKDAFNALYCIVRYGLAD